MLCQCLAYAVVDRDAVHLLTALAGGVTPPATTPRPPVSFAYWFMRSMWKAP